MTDLARASSFGGVAADYDRFRPAPPAEAAAWVLAAGSGPATDRHRPVVELAAGTGLFTRRLLDQDRRVVATEPDARMQAVAVARSDGALAVRATAERLPLAPASAGAVVVSSAWHWMDPEATTAEVARVLVGGGTFGIVGNGPDRTHPWVAYLFDAVRGGRAEAGPGGGPGPSTNPASRRRVVLPDGAPFGPPETTEVAWSLPVTRGDLLGLVGTYSRVIVLDPDGREAHLAAASDRIDEATDDLDAVGWRLPLRCRCWRAMRR